MHPETKQFAIEQAKTVLPQILFTNINAYVDTLFDKEKGRKLTEQELNFLKNTTLSEMSFENIRDSEFFTIKNNTTKESMQFSNRVPRLKEFRGVILRDYLTKEATVHSNASIYDTITYAISTPKHSDFVTYYKTPFLQDQDPSNRISEEHLDLFIETIFSKLQENAKKLGIPPGTTATKEQLKEIWEGIDCEQIFDYTETLAPINSKQFSEKSSKLGRIENFDAAMEAHQLYLALQEKDYDLIEGRITPQAYTQQCRTLILKSEEHELNRYAQKMRSANYVNLTSEFTEMQSKLEDLNKKLLEGRISITDFNNQAKQFIDSTKINELHQKFLISNAVSDLQAELETASTVFTNHADTANADTVQGLKKKLGDIKEQFDQGLLSPDEFNTAFNPLLTQIEEIYKKIEPDMPLYLLKEKKDAFYKQYQGFLISNALGYLQSKIEIASTVFTEHASTANTLVKKLGHVKEQLDLGILTPNELSMACKPLLEEVEKINKNYLLAFLNEKSEDLTAKKTKLTSLEQGTQVEQSITDLLKRVHETMARLSEDNIQSYDFKEELNNLSTDEHELNEIIKLYQAVDLKKIDAKATELSNNHHYSAAGVANHLINQLTSEKQKLLRRQVTSEEFKTNCIAHIKHAETAEGGVLGQHRGFFSNLWHDILTGFGIRKKEQIEPTQSIKTIRELETSLNKKADDKPNSLEIFTNKTNSIKEALHNLKMEAEKVAPEEPQEERPSESLGSTRIAGI